MNEMNSGAPAADALNVGSQVSEATESQNDSQEGSESQEQAPQAATIADRKRLKQLQLKIDGEELTEDLPFEVDEEHAEYLRKNLQLSKKAQKSMQETSTIKSQVQDFVKMLTSDTKAALAQLGIDPKEFAASVIEEELKLQAMSPEQRERLELQQKLKALEEEREREKEDSNQRELARLQQQEYERVETKMVAAIESSGIPRSTYAIKKMASYMMDGAKEGVMLEPEDVVELVKQEIQEDLREMINALGEDKVESFIGKDILDKVRKKNISKIKQTPASAKSGIKEVASAKSQTKPSEKMSIKDFFKV
jgi:hypothetical protein